MKRQLFIILFLTLLLSCSEKERDFDSLEYSYGDTFSTVYSIKFTENDTVYLREHWNGVEMLGTPKIPKEKTNYFAVLSEGQRNQLTELVRTIDFNEINSEYYQDYEDGSSYQIIIKKDSFKKTVFVHSDSVPQKLERLSKWINEIKNTLKLIETSSQLEYESMNGFMSPPPPPPPMRRTSVEEK